jgi:hypothetical protein
MMRIVPIVFGLVLAVSAGLSPVFAADKRPVVVELFTSQGCSSCPPAEAFLNDLTKRKDVIALEFHVDYWDYIGWKDLFAKPEFTARQKSYVYSMGSRYAYTPQMVIDGREHVVGSHRAKVESVIRKAQAKASKAPPIKMRREGKNLIISVGAARASGDYVVTMATFDKPHVTKVKRGENRGMTLTNANVVRELVKIGDWNGKASEYTISLDGTDGDGGCAILIQKKGHGPVLAAASMPFLQ